MSATKTHGWDAGLSTATSMMGLHGPPSHPWIKYILSSVYKIHSPFISERDAIFFITNSCLIYYLCNLSKVVALGGCCNGAVAYVMRHTRAKYHRSVKWTQRHQNDIKKKNMTESILANNTHNFWSEMRKSRNFWSEVRKASNNHNVPVKVIDDVYGDEEISNYFASKYEDLCSSVSYSQTDMLDVVSTINARIEKRETSHFTAF